VIIADTSGLLALFNAREPRHAEVARAVDAVEAPLLVSPFVLAELDYLVATRLGLEAELAVLDELGGGAYVMADFEPDDIVSARGVIARYPDQEIGLADASLVVLADRFATRTILTLDRRHFDVVRPLTGGRFTVVP
jgi:predicted nucleic acid-binding protein